METIDRSQEIAGTEDYGAQVYRADGTTEFANFPVQAEHTLDVYIDGRLSMRIVCSPDHLIELVIGRLFTEGIIDSADDIDLVHLCEYSTKARVLLKEHRQQIKEVTAPVVPSCCTGNKVFASVERDAADLVPVKPIEWDPAWIFNLAQAFAQDTPMHRSTFGAHSCFLASGDKILYCCEDLGRHNAFDKVIGCALRDHVDLRSSIIFSSGRLPVDMVTKAIRSGIPVLASKAVPTDLTIELAKRFDLTLICAAHPDSMKVYNDPRWGRLAQSRGSWKVERVLDASSEMDDELKNR